MRRPRLVNGGCAADGVVAGIVPEVAVVILGIGVDEP